MDAKRFKSRSWLLVFGLLLISGCVANAERIIEIQPNAIKQDSKVGVVWISPCSSNAGCKQSGEASSLGQFVPDGANGLLVYGMVMSAHEDVINALDEVSADPIVQANYLNPISAALEGKQAIPSVSKPPIYQGDLSKSGKHSVMRMRDTLEELHPGGSSIYHGLAFDQPYDLTAIANELDSSTLVVLHVQEFGVRRSFGPLGIPTGRPYGLSLVRAFVWDVATKSDLYSDFGIARADIGGNWREAGHWTQVFTATNTALELAIDRVTGPLIEAISSQ